MCFFWGIISWKGASLVSVGEGGLFFRWGASILSGGCTPWGGIGFDRGFSKKNLGWGGGASPHVPHYGKPCTRGAYYSTPYESPVAMANVLMQVGLWSRAIKLNPSWKTEVSKYAWIKPCTVVRKLLTIGFY